MSLVSLLHGIVRPDAHCTVPLLQDLEAGSVPGIDVYFSVFTLIKLQFGVNLSLSAAISTDLELLYFYRSLYVSFYATSLGTNLSFLLIFLLKQSCSKLTIGLSLVAIAMSEKMLFKFLPLIQDRY